MIKVLQIQPKDIYVVFEAPLSDLELIVESLEHAEIKFDGRDEKQRRATEVIKDFYELLTEVIKDVKK